MAAIQPSEIFLMYSISPPEILIFAPRQYWTMLYRSNRKSFVLILWMLGLWTLLGLAASGWLTKTT